MQELQDLLSSIMEDAQKLFKVPAIALGSANPPATAGVYAFSYAGELTYVGEARGSGGLRDRLLNKHLSGDEGHTLQRVFRTEFPDREQRRDFIRKNVFVQWIAIPDGNRVSAVERVLICLYRPKWNRK